MRAFGAGMLPWGGLVGMGHSMFSPRSTTNKCSHKYCLSFACIVSLREVII